MEQLKSKKQWLKEKRQKLGADLSKLEIPKFSPTSPWSRNRLAIKAARELYLKHYSEQVILFETKLPKSIYDRFKVKWEEKRNKHLDNLINEHLKRGKFREIEDIFGLTLVGLKKYIHRLVTREEELEAKEAKLLSDVVANIHRIARLEEGKPTDIRKYETLTPEELKAEARNILLDLQAEDDLVDYVPTKPEIH